MTSASADAEAIVALEQALLTRPVRRDRYRLDALLQVDFCEIGASGGLWDRESIIDALVADPRAPDGHAGEVRSVRLAPDIVLVTYVLQRPPPRPAPGWTATSPWS